jgi:uncharacterized membrane protein
MTRFRPPVVRLPVQLEALRERLWVIPAIAAFVAAVLAWAFVRIDHALGTGTPDGFFFGGGPESARLMLSTIAAAMLTFTGLVFTVTMLVLQLASSQFSPRITRTFLRDRSNQLVLGIFVATFVYALLVLRDVRSVDGESFVPSIAVWFAFAFLLASVAAFVFYIDHMAHAMRVTTIIGSVAAETRAAIDRCYPDPATGDDPASLHLPPRAATISTRGAPGVLQGVDVDGLATIARDSGSAIELVHGIGDPIPGGAPIAIIHGGTGIIADGVLDALAIGRERTMHQDAAFGFRQLVDVAVRALSPGTNDPTTASQVIEQLHDLLRRLASRRLGGTRRSDDDGTLRVVIPGSDWADFVDLACAEIAAYGAGSIQVNRALYRMLDDLDTVVSDERRPAIRRQRERLPPIPDSAAPPDETT